MKKIILITFVILLTNQSCLKNEKIDLVQQTDLKGKFEIGIPKNWNIEKEMSEKTSFLIASDTTKTIESTMIIDLTWNDWEIYLNQHLRRSLDSINELAGFKTSKQKFYSKGEFDIYEYEAEGIDSLNNVGVKVRNFFLKKNRMKGSLNLNIRINNRNFGKQDSLLIERIMRTIKRK